MKCIRNLRKGDHCVDSSHRQIRGASSILSRILQRMPLLLLYYGEQYSILVQKKWGEGGGFVLICTHMGKWEKLQSAVGIPYEFGMYEIQISIGECSQHKIFE